MRFGDRNARRDTIRRYARDITGDAAVVNPYWPLSSYLGSSVPATSTVISSPEQAQQDVGLMMFCRDLHSELIAERLTSYQPMLAAGCLILWCDVRDFDCASRRFSATLIADGRAVLVMDHEVIQVIRMTGYRPDL